MVYACGQMRVTPVYSVSGDPLVIMRTEDMTVSQIAERPWKQKVFPKPELRRLAKAGWAMTIPAPGPPQTDRGAVRIASAGGKPVTRPSRGRTPKQIPHNR